MRRSKWPFRNILFQNFVPTIKPLKGGFGQLDIGAYDYF